MAQFLEPPPSYVGQFNYLWIGWLRKVYENIKSVEDSVEGAFAGNAFTTGDIKVRLGGTTPPSGWILWDDGTIGNASSGAGNRANDDTYNLFVRLYDSYSNTICPVSSGRGANADADWAANKTLTLPVGAGRTIGVVGSGSGLTSRSDGDTVGAETHQLTVAQMPAHTHQYYEGSGLGSNYPTFDKNAQSGTGSPTSSTGNGPPGSAHNIMQPTSFYPWFIKL